MADEFVMPKLGLTMESGTIVGWLVEDGTDVQSGQPVLLIETDKVESEVESTQAGRFHSVGEVGQEYPCGAPIGWFLADGEKPPAPAATITAPATSTAVASAAMAGSGPGAPAAAVATPVAGHASVAATGIGGRLLASPNAKRLAAARGIDLRTVAGSGPGGRITSEDVPINAPQAAPAHLSAPIAAGGGVGRLATAAGRSLAELLGIDIAEVAPRGPDPRVDKEDVAAYVRNQLAAAGPPIQAAAGAGPASVTTASGPALPSPLQEPSEVIPLTGMRGTIASRMSESLHSMAQLTLTMDVDMDGVVADRTRRKAEAADGEAVPGYTDYVIAATAAALTSNPVINSQITDTGVALLPHVNIGLAVALDVGLIVPVVHNTPSLSIENLGAETSRLAEAARAGKLTLPELEGGTFSVTALGMFDVDGFTPIINAPNTAILGVGRLRDDVAWNEDGSPRKATRLTLSLTWDHRAFDGAPAAEFTRAIKTALEVYTA